MTHQQDESGAGDPSTIRPGAIPPEQMDQAAAAAERHERARHRSDQLVDHADHGTPFDTQRAAPRALFQERVLDLRRPDAIATHVDDLVGAIPSLRAALGSARQHASTLASPAFATNSAHNYSEAFSASAPVH